MENQNKKKRKSSFRLLFQKLFGIHEEELDIFQEEQLQSPMRTVVRNFCSNKLAITGLVVFILMLLFVTIGPLFAPIDLSFNESTQTNIGPGRTMLKVPKELNGNVADISAGASFSLGADKNGKVYIWGKTKITRTINLKDMPKDMGKIVQVAAGYDHAMALAEDGTVYAWGNNRLKQAKLPDDIYDHGKIVQIAAGYQLSVAVTDEGYVIFWGNESINDVRVKKRSQQGNIKKVVLTSMTMFGLTNDGEVLHLGKQDSDVSRIPEEIQGRVTDISAAAASLIAVLDDGSLVPWGTLLKGERDIPEINEKVVSITAGRYHYTALTESGRVYSWGYNNYNQTDVPSGASSGVSAVYSGYYQNYAVKNDGSIKTWGLKGYLLGSDDLGRDVFSRLINGGRMTMTVGAVAVIISTIIGILIGGISGFFGGKVDLVLQRITEVFSAMPFLPFAMILSTIIGNRLPENLRIYLIMVVLGVLSWPQLSRLVRAQVLAEREKEFVTAARAMGVNRFSIVFKHIIPNVISVIIVSATLDFATCMLTEATLSYLGFGVQLPRPTWGNMLFGCNDSVVIQYYWWRWVFVAIFLSICVICINMVGDGLRDAIDPKSNER